MKPAAAHQDPAGTRAIASVGWGLPTEWVGWPHDDITEAEAHLLRIEPDAVTRAAVMAAVRELDALSRKETPGTAGAAIWVPGQGYRKPLATGLLRVTSTPPSGPMSVATMLTTARDGARPGPWGRLLDVAVSPSRVTAGEAVLRIADRARRFSRRVSREWAWFILPPGTGQIVACQFESTAVEHFDLIADFTTDIANAVEVTLEPA